MSVLEQVQSLIIRPGAKPDRIVMGVDLTELGEAPKVLSNLVSQGYQPEIRYLELAVGLHLFAVLKNEAYTTEERYEEILDEWEGLCEALTPDDLNKAVRLWRGMPAPTMVSSRRV
jgi:hypothetical protein